jgi:hypothetical protein
MHRRTTSSATITPTDTIEHKNPATDVLQKLSEAHDLAIDRFVTDVLKPRIRVSTGNSGRDLDLVYVAADNVTTGVRTYTIGPIPEALSSADLLGCVNNHHCNACSRPSRYCQASVDNAFIALNAQSARQRLRCLIISRQVPVPMSAKELRQFIVWMLVFALAITALAVCYRQLYSIWQGHYIAWLGLTL